MAQTALGREHDEGLPPAPQHLPAQNVKILRGRRRSDNLYVVVGGQFQKPLGSGAGVLWPLPFQAVREQQDEAAQSPPFLFGTDEELVDDDLRRIAEISILRLPQDQPFGAI